MKIYTFLLLRLPFKIVTEFSISQPGWEEGRRVVSPPQWTAWRSLHYLFVLVPGGMGTSFSLALPVNVTSKIEKEQHIFLTDIKT